LPRSERSVGGKAIDKLKFAGRLGSKDCKALSVSYIESGGCPALNGRLGKAIDKLKFAGRRKLEKLGGP